MSPTLAVFWVSSAIYSDKHNFSSSEEDLEGDSDKKQERRRTHRGPVGPQPECRCGISKARKRGAASKDAGGLDTCFFGVG